MTDRQLFVVERALSLWNDDIRDPALLDRSPEAELHRANIQNLVAKGLGWSGWTCRNTKSPDYEKPVTRYCGNTCMSWCGTLPAFCYEPLGLSAKARAACASTFKLWQRMPSKDPRRVLDFTRIEPGDVGVVRTGKGLKWGDHIVVPIDRPQPDRTVVTIEANAKGEGPTGERYEGIVKKTRALSEFVACYRFGESDFESR